eukprot:4564440-Pleurochrysis_carterae.AAC.1
MASVSPNTQLVDDVCQSWFTNSSESENEGKRGYATHIAQRQVRGLVLSVQCAQRQVPDGSTTLRAPVYASHPI